MLWHKVQGAGSFDGGRDVVTDNIVLRLEADNSNSYSGTGTNWVDLSLENNNGILTNGPVFNNTYFEFDGNDDYVELGTISTTNPLQLASPVGGGLTIMFATYWNGTGDSYPRVFDKSYAGNALGGWSVFPDFTNPSGIVHLLRENPGPTTGDGSALRSNTLVGVNTWEIMAVTHQKSNGAWSWFKNGNLLNSGVDAYAIPSLETNARIGTWNHNTGREWNGKIGFFYVYEKVLSLSEIQQNYDAWKDTFGLT